MERVVKMFPQTSDETTLEIIVDILCHGDSKAIKVVEKLLKHGGTLDDLSVLFENHITGQRIVDKYEKDCDGDVLMLLNQIRALKKQQTVQTSSLRR